MNQNYGLNEIGIVAVRCRAGRYHVNNEHCLVEIVDSEGRTCPPGTSGHVLVTTLRNIASPLLRYDTGDIAEVADGPCPCGRTLPSFGEIIGRYRRFAGLPAGTRERVRALLKAFELMPLEFTRHLRRYQIYQDREDHFEVRLTTVGPMPPEFEARVREQWEKDCQNSRPLRIVEGATITTSPGGKLMDFDSAFYSRDDMASRARVEEKMVENVKTPSS
jgi:phenylacetate-CoA ligase